MTGELTAVDVSWRARDEAFVRDALLNATITDCRVAASDDGSVKITYLDARRSDDRIVISEQGYRTFGKPCPDCSDDGDDDARGRS